MDYPHARVRLHFCKVFDWRGAFQMRERQAMAWQSLPVQVAPVLPGTIPVLRWFAQELGSNDVLMFAFMNREALARTAELGEAVYFSRSRGRLWHKGEESGHIQKVHELRLDCDNDVVLLKVEQLGHATGEPGIACHTGRHSCFFQLLKGGAWTAVEPVLKDPARIYK